ncbi:MAG: hemerythrin family protein [Nitrospirae bacterium]|nr:hemerythrin family protein [Nitrospirota bacterium]
MAFKWTEELSVGVETIDNQHKELITIVDNLIRAIVNGRGKDEIEKVISFLKQYVETHFSMEEKLMERIRYPKDKLLEHEAQHTQFWENFNELLVAFRKDHKSPALIKTVNTVLIDWYKNHICKTDKSIGEFIRKR